MSSSPSTPGEVTVHVVGRTDVGRTREHNEDAFVIVDLATGAPAPQSEVRTHAVGPKGTLFMVADGMGGAAAGEIASAMAIDAVLAEMRLRWMPLESTNTEAFVLSLIHI